jgi:hypothetical protein
VGCATHGSAASRCCRLCAGEDPFRLRSRSDVPEPRPTNERLSKSLRGRPPKPPGQAPKASGAGKASSSENDPGPPTRFVQNARVRVFHLASLGYSGSVLDNSESRLPAPETFGACPGDFRGLPRRLSGPAPETFGACPGDFRGLPRRLSGLPRRLSGPAPETFGACPGDFRR